jgi:hypothetical protein
VTDGLAVLFACQIANLEELKLPQGSSPADVLEEMADGIMKAIFLNYQKAAITEAISAASAQGGDEQPNLRQLLCPCGRGKAI